MAGTGDEELIAVGEVVGNVGHVTVDVGIFIGIEGNLLIVVEDIEIEVFGIEERTVDILCRNVESYKTISHAILVGGVKHHRRVGRNTASGEELLLMEGGGIIGTYGIERFATAVCEPCGGGVERMLLGVVVEDDGIEGIVFVVCTGGCRAHHIEMEHAFLVGTHILTAFESHLVTLDLALHHTIGKAFHKSGNIDIVAVEAHLHVMAVTVGAIVEDPLLHLHSCRHGRRLVGKFRKADVGIAVSGPGSVLISQTYHQRCIVLPDTVLLDVEHQFGAGLVDLIGVGIGIVYHSRKDEIVFIAVTVGIVYGLGGIENHLIIPDLTLDPRFERIGGKGAFHPHRTILGIYHTADGLSDAEALTTIVVVVGVGGGRPVVLHQGSCGLFAVDAVLVLCKSMAKRKCT